MTDRHDIYEGTDLTEAEVEAARKFAREKPSTSYLQRRMQIPYSHATRLMGLLEAEGLVSARNAAGKRTILHPNSWWCGSCAVEVYQLRCPHCGKTSRELR